MLTLEQIGQMARNNLQMVIEQVELDLAVGPINDEDCRILCNGYGHLEWDYGIGKYGNDPDKFEFCIKLIKQKTECAPAGASLCVYSESAKTLNIHFIESFVRDDEDHPLKGRMVMLTLMAAYLFTMGAGGNKVQVIDPDAELIEYYKSFNLRSHDDTNSMSARVEDLLEIFSRFINQ